MKPRVIWTEEEEAIFDKYYNRVSLPRLREMIPNKSRHALMDLGALRGWNVDSKKTKPTPEDIEWLKANWPEHGCVTGDLVRKLNMRIGLIRKLGRDLGLFYSDQRKNFTEDERELVRAMIDSGKSFQEIDDEIEYRSTAVVRYLVKRSFFYVDKTLLHPSIRELKCI